VQLDVPIIAASEKGAVERAARAIVAGGVVGCPTETRYGLLTRGLDEAALERVVAIKGRPDGNPIPLLISDVAQLELLMADSVPEAVTRLLNRFWPGPLTLVCTARKGLPAAILSARGEVGLRISPDRVATALVRTVGEPLTATSANISGQPAATTAEQAALPGLAMVLDDGLREQPPTTVLRVQTDGVEVLREGALSRDDLLAFLQAPSSGREGW
jgi:L-threonylcarbamoyladenylate synthase